MLPFLKKRDDGGASGPVEKLERKPDDDNGAFGMLDAVAEDLLAALEKKDKVLVKEALEALCLHIQDMDSEQDEMMGDMK